MPGGQAHRVDTLWSAQSHPPSPLLVGQPWGAGKTHVLVLENRMREAYDCVGTPIRIPMGQK